jgi:WD40 repeat protein
VLVLGTWPAATATACLSPSLLVASVQAVMASVIAPRVAALTEGMVKAMFANRLKIAAILFLALGGSGTGLALALQEPPRAEATRVVKQPAPPERPRPGADARAKPEPDMGRPIRTLSGHKERVTSVAYSPDGRWIATAAWDGTARLWDAQTGKEVRRLDMAPTRDYRTAHLSRVLFSPDSEFIVVAQQAAPNEAGVIVWNRRTGEKVQEFPGGYGSVAVSPDGRLIACGGWGSGVEVNTGAIRLYELAAGKPVRELRGHQSRVELLAFSPDGETVIAVVGIPRPPLPDGKARMGFDPWGVRAWDVATGKERRSTWNGLWNGPLLATSPDGRTVAAGTTLRETATGGECARLVGHTNDVCAVAFSPDGRTLGSGSMDGTVRLWDLPSGKEVARFGKEVPKFGGRGWVLAVAFSPDGRTLVSGGLDKTVHLWDVSRIIGRQRKRAERSPADLKADWEDLAGDATAGYAALGRLMSSPREGVAFLGKQLQSMKPPDARRIERLIAELDDERFPAREQAAKELEALAEYTAPALRKALAGKPALEVRRRLGALLDRLEGARPSAETVRQIRAVEALESIGNPEARQLLDKLATGPAEMRLTQEAKAAARRLAKPAVIAP